MNNGAARVKVSGRGPPQGRQSNDEGSVVDVSTLHVSKSTTLGFVMPLKSLSKGLWHRPLEGGRRKGNNQMSKELCLACQKQQNVNQRHQALINLSIILGIATHLWAKPPAAGRRKRRNPMTKDLLLTCQNKMLDL